MSLTDGRATIRMLPACELCGAQTWHDLPELTAHHVVTKGHGGGRRCDHRFNLLGLCAVCHARVHTEGITGVLQTLVARREGRTVEEVKRIVREELKK